MNDIRLAMFFTGLMILSVLNVKAEISPDTIFLNKKWKIITQKDTATYFRIISKVDNGYLINDYFISGVLQMTGISKSKKINNKTGYFKFFDEKGALKLEGNYSSNRKTGEWKIYKDASLQMLRNYKNGRLNGEFIVYYPDGKIKRKENYAKGVFKSGNCFARNGSDTLYYPFRTMPVFLADSGKVAVYINKTLVYPSDLISQNVTGKVWVKFCINEDGKVGDISIKESTQPLLNQSALDVFRRMPDWMPANENGEPVLFYMVLPVRFLLE